MLSLILENTMNIIEVNDAIKELESADSSLSNIRNLASLYIVQGQMQGKLNSVMQQSNDAVLTELYEVIPSYKQYVIAKRRRQLNEISEDVVLDTLSRLGKELRDFIKSLYTATASENERILLSKIIADLKNVT